MNGVGEKMLKLTVLVDNNTLTQIDADFRGEPGLSFFIEAEQKKILFDTGYSDLFIKNAQKMHIDLQHIHNIVLSHGHYDHTWGLISLIQLYFCWAMQGFKVKHPTLLSHPDVFLSKTKNKRWQIGSLINQDEISKWIKIKLSKSPVWITKRMVYLGEIPKKNDFEGLKSIGKVKKGNGWIDDYLLEDSALACKTKKGLVIITGCSHAGICNIIEYAKMVCRESRIIDIIGGFHLQNPSKKQLKETLDYLEKLNSPVIHACHCTDFHSKIALSKVAKIEEVGVGLILKYE
ncbi:MAG: MBL fold metallo-hydrolase [Candidatus Aminicenantes bacterium]|nr:MBL fold metallo-hydrolase [Candidatus Aminicenantes bacterium]